MKKTTNAIVLPPATEIHIRKLSNGWGVLVKREFSEAVHGLSTYAEVLALLAKEWPQKRGKK